MTQDTDISEIREGSAGEYETLRELHDGCEESAENYHYLSKGWNEYLRDIFSNSIKPDF